MASASEPYKWVCRLVVSFENDERYCGTGFLVHIPNSAKLCIITAGHNIIQPEHGWAKNIQVTFPGGLAFSVNGNECRVSQVYENNPTISDEDSSSLSDYGLIITDREKHLAHSSDRRDPGGCGFDVLIQDSEIMNTSVSLCGYAWAREELEMHSSRLNQLDRYALYDSMKTTAGFCGAPIMIFEEGAYSAIGIHTRYGCAVRLTSTVMFEILSWIDDYPLRRVFEVRTHPGCYLRATDGPRPAITARPGIAYLNCVLASALQTGRNKQACRYVVLPGAAYPGQPGPLLFLSLCEQIIFSSEEPNTHKQLGIQFLLQRRPGREATVLCWPGDKWKTSRSPSDRDVEDPRQFVEVKRRERAKHCNFGCITQDHQVVVNNRNGTKFSVYPYESTKDCQDRQDTECLDLSPLYRAVLNHKIQEAMKLLDNGAEPNVSCVCGTTALSKAAENGDLIMVNALMKHGANIETKNRDGESPETLAHRNGHLDMGTRLQHFRSQLLERFLDAAKKGSMDEMNQLLGRGVDPRARNVSSHFISRYSDSSALEIASEYGNQNAVLFLLRDAKVAATSADRRSVTPLHKAAHNGHVGVIKHLLAFGANPNARDEESLSPLHRAAACGHSEAIAALCSGDIGPSLDSRSLHGVTPLMLAAQNGRSSAVELLVKLSADVTLMDCKGESARDKAEKRGNLDICDILSFPSFNVRPWQYVSDAM